MRAACLSALSMFLPALVTAAPPQFDLKQPQTPALPAPRWLKLVDHGSDDPRLKGYRAPEGIRIEIVAEEPTVVNPVGMIFGNDGTLYVLEWRPSPGDEWRETPETFTYKDGSKRNVATMKKKTKDVLKVLKWSSDKKLYDRSEIILEDELPSSILLHDGWIYLASRGSVRRYRQSQPGGAYDVKEVIAQGFCGFHHHQVSGMTIGMDGWLYITSGDDDNFVEGSDGSRATVLRTGAVFRCRPDGSKMHTYSLGYRNPYRDVAFDTAFNIFHVDNDNEDGSKFTGCRLMHVAEEADFGWRLFTGARCCRPDHVRGAVFGELPGKLPAMLKTGRGSPAGLLIYNDTQFPQQFRGLLYYPDVFRKLIRAYRVEPDGSTFQAIEEFEFLKSDDPLFRPCQTVVGPDGAMYVCDWRTDSGGAGRLWGDGKHGRIYRLSWAGTSEQPDLPLRAMDSWNTITPKASLETLFTQICAADFSTQTLAQRALMLRAKDDAPNIRKRLLKEAGPESGSPLTVRLLCLGALQAVWDDEVRRAFMDFLRDKESDVVRMAADGLALASQPGDMETHHALTAALNTAHGAAARAVILALGRVGAPGAEDILANALKADTGRDVYFTDAIVRSLERLGERGVRKFVDIANSGVDKDRDRAVSAFVTLRTRAGVTLLPELLHNPHVSSTQRTDLLRSYGNYLLEPPLGPEALIDILQGQLGANAEAKIAGLETLTLFGPIQSDKGAALLVSLIADSNSGVRLAALKTIEQGRVKSAVPHLIARLAQDRAGAEKIALVRALRVFNDAESKGPLVKILGSDVDRSSESQTLQLEALRSLALLDPAAANPLAEKFLDEPGELQNAAIAILGAQAAGARTVAERYLAKKLPRDVLPQVTDGLRKHLEKDQQAAKLLTEVMKGGLLVSLEKAEIEKVQTLVRTKGDAAKGRELFLNAKTVACINCHKLEGVGGNVGPDLTRVWETLSLDKVMESMIEPSKEIKEGYQAYRVLTKNGQTYTGLRVAQNAAGVTLKEATGKELQIRTADIEELEVSKQSLMPDNVISQLSFEQFIDLVAFLRNRAAQESFRGMVLEYLVVGPFPGDFTRAFPPEPKPNPEESYDGAKAGAKLTWQNRAVEPTGFLDLRAALGEDRALAYALAFVHSPAKQKVRLLLGVSGPTRIWVGGKQVFETSVTRAPKADADEVVVELQAGWTPVLVKTVHATGAHGFFLRFASGEGLRTSTKME